MIKNDVCRTWEVIDLTFESTFKNNPFRDVEFYADISCGDYKKIVHGFYNGNNTFVIRLCFDLPGEYSYTTHSNIDELDSISGTISVIPNNDSTKHGPVVLNKDNPNRLYYQDGTTYNLCAIECDWLFALSYDERDKLTKTKELIQQFSDNKFNHVVMNVYAYDLQWERDEWIKDPKIKPEHNYSCRNDIFPFLGNNINPDFSQLNVEFFKHLDNVISLLNDKNIVAHLMIYVWNKKVNWPEPNSDADNMYFDYVIKRYQAFPNLVWDISKEALGYGHCDMNYIVDRIRRLKSLDSYNRLVTVHDYRFCNKYPDLVDIISIQTWVLDIHCKMEEIAKEHPDKVIFNIEHGGYEESPYQIFTGNYTDPKVCLRRNYEIMFAGAYSCYYWQALSWSIIMLPNEADIPPKFEYYKHMIDFFDAHDYANLIPDDTVGHGGFSMVHKNKNLVIMYAPKENYAVTFTGFRRMKGTRASYQFFNTITGEYSERKFVEQKDFVKFISPFDEDSILIIRIDK